MHRRPKLLSKRTAFTGRVFRVDRESVRLSHGGIATLDIVRHRGSVILIPQPTPASIVLIRQYRHAIKRWIWELPAGSLEAGERPATGARRECEEEIGLTPGRLRRLAAFYPTPGFCDERMTFYLCTALRPVTRAVAHDADEQIEPRTFSIREAWRLVARGGIVDMKTVLGLVLIQRK